MTLMGKATEKSLEEVSRAVLAPHFHVEGMPPKKVCPPLSAPHATPRRGGRRRCDASVVVEVSGGDRSVARWSAVAGSR